MRFPVFDLHCDTALALWDRSFTVCDSLRSNQLHIDLERAGQLAGYAQCFACFTTTFASMPEEITPEMVFEKELSGILSQININVDMIQLATGADDILTNTSNGQMSAILTIEGPAGFGYCPEKLEELYRMGFRITTLGWNERNILCGSCVTGGGLTDLGREYVRQAQRLGMLVDVSHISDEAFWDIMDITQRPVIASHSNSRAIWNVPRNLTDDMYRAICDTGGTVGINLYTAFLGDSADLNTVCDHILHFLELVPEEGHISLGGDLDGCDDLPIGFSGVQDYDKLADQLLLRGIDPKTVSNIFWNNAIEVMRKCSM
ncbi:MAG: membrane dipeptidase [Oscillospiraceae bacterium]|nr:membrane dipeptidase [Oscillospiraceae bacterium]